MPDRVIRDELLNSARFVNLPSDTDRMAYVGLRIRSDDFGNIEGGLWNLSRFLASFTSIKTEETTAIVLGHLVDADLIRAYQVNHHDFYHLPRSRPVSWYLVRKCPPSPWCDPNAKLGKHVRSVRNQGLAKNLPVTSLERPSDVSQGKGKGKGKGKGEGKKQQGAASASLPPWLSTEAWQKWSRHRGAKLTKQAVTLQLGKLEALRKAGHDPAALIDLAIESGWATFYPPRGGAEKTGRATANDEIWREQRSDDAAIDGTAERIDE